MIRAIVSDFGGVLTTPLSEAFRGYQDESGIKPEDLGRAMARAQERYGEHPLFELERGEITELEFRERIEAHLEAGFDLTRLRTVYFERLTENRAMIDFIAEQRRRGTRTALLTNNVREWEPIWRSKLPEVDELFEVVIDSAFVGMRKPDPEIYALTLHRLGLPAEACVFIDDLEHNIVAARECGLIGRAGVDLGQPSRGGRVAGIQTGAMTCRFQREAHHDVGGGHAVGVERVRHSHGGATLGTGFLSWKSHLEVLRGTRARQFDWKNTSEPRLQTCSEASAP